MTGKTWSKCVIGALVGAWVLQPNAARACAACYGRSDSSLAQGMNMGILSLLVMVVTVLATFAGFFIFLARRSAKVAGNAAASAPSEAATHSST